MDNLELFKRIVPDAIRKELENNTAKGKPIRTETLSRFVDSYSWSSKSHSIPRKLNTFLCRSVSYSPISGLEEINPTLNLYVDDSIDFSFTDLKQADTLFETQSIIKDQHEAVVILFECYELKKGNNVIALDVETNKSGKVISIQACFNGLFTLFFDGYILSMDVMKQVTKRLLLVSDTLIMHNAKFDIKALINTYKLSMSSFITHNIIDTFLLECMLTNGTQDRELSLGAVMKKYLDVTLDKTYQEKFLTRAETPFSDPEIAYACLDVAFLHSLVRQQLTCLVSIDQLSTYFTIEQEFLKVLVDMELAGLKLDKEKWEDWCLTSLENLETTRAKLDSTLFADSRTEKYRKKYIQGNLFAETTVDNSSTINWNSPKQVLEVFNLLGIPITENVDKKTINIYQYKFPIVKDYMDFKEQGKLVSTYGKNVLDFVKSDGSVYSDYGGSLTTILTDSTANRSYIEGLTQMVIVNYVLYISSGGNAAQVIRIPLNSYNGSYSSGADLSWLTTTKGVSYSHAPSQPLYVWENNLWIGNENKIHRYTPSSDTMSSSVLVLNSDNVITSIGSDSVANNLFVAISIGYNGNKSRSINNKIFIWDGINVKPSRASFVEGTVSAFYNVAGLTYILYGESGLGYWNGSGITLLRQLRILKGTNQPILNQYTITNWKNNLVVVDGNRILMYASIKNRPKAWYCVYVSLANNTDGFNYFNFVTTYDEDNLLISYNYLRSNTIRTRLLKLPMNVEEITNFYTDRGFTGKISLAPIDFKDNLVKVRAVKIIMNKLIQLT